MANNSFLIRKGVVGFNPLSSAPSSPTNGDIYYDSTLGLFQAYQNGAWGSLGGSATGVTFSATAGESLALGDSVYICSSAGDGGRTVGQVYKLDATNDSRVEYAGISTGAVSLGGAATIQLGGELGGLSGIPQGLPVFASVTTPGAFQTSPPTVLNQWIIQIGQGSTTAAKLLINGAGSASAIKITSQLSSSSYPDFSRPLKFVAGSNVSTDSFNNTLVMSFANNVDGDVYTEFVVPQNYITGTEIALLIPFAVNASGNIFFTIISDLYRGNSGIDSISSVPTGRRTQTYTVAASGTTFGVSTSNAIKVTDSSGFINGIAVSPKDIIVVKLQRTASSGSDTAEADLKMFDSELSYKGGSIFGGTLYVNNSAKTANYTVLASDDILFGDATGGAFTFTLPVAAGNSGKILRFVKTDSSTNALTLDGSGSETIDGALTTTLNTQYERVEIACNGTGWYILSRTYPAGWTLGFGVTPTQFGTISASEYRMRRVGDSIEVSGTFTFGSPAASVPTIDLPAGYVIDTAKLSIQAEVGRFYQLTSSSTATLFGNQNESGPMFFDGADTDSIYMAESGRLNAFNKQNASSLFTTNSTIAFRFVVPIVGWKG